MPNIINLQRVSLSESGISERQIEEEIVKNPSVLELGNLELVERQRIQPTGGRLDLLFQHPQANKRYEVEIQLGDTNESHIVRTLEYWDSERKRYQQYDHCAVIVAENITSRFFNVISLFNGFVPIIAIKLEARKLDDKIILSCVRVLDENIPGVEEEERNIRVTDRNFWLKEKAAKETLEITDDLLDIINEIAPGHKLNYTRFYIGLVNEEGVNNFIEFIPRRARVVEVDIKLPFSEKLQKIIEEREIENLDYDFNYKKAYRLKLAREDLSKHKDFIKDLFFQAYNS